MSKLEDAEFALPDRPGFRAEYRLWFRQDAFSAFVVELFGPGSRGRQGARQADTEGVADETVADETVVDLLYASDGRYALAWDHGGPHAGRRVVFDGRIEWRVTPGETITASDRPRSAFGRLLEPRLQRPGMMVVDQPEDADTFEGRSIHRVRMEKGRTQPGRHRSSQAEAERSTVERMAELVIPDSVELVIDDEFGLVLSERAFREGECIRSQQITHITPLADVDASAFVFVPPKGARVAMLGHTADGRPDVQLPLAAKIEVAGRLVRAAARLARRKSA